MCVWLLVPIGGVYAMLGSRAPEETAHVVLFRVPVWLVDGSSVCPRRCLSVLAGAGCTYSAVCYDAPRVRRVWGVCGSQILFDEGCFLPGFALPAVGVPSYSAVGVAWPCVVTVGFRVSSYWPSWLLVQDPWGAWRGRWDALASG